MTSQTVERPRFGGVSIRPLQRADSDKIRTWMSNPELVRFTVLVPGPEYAQGGLISHESTERYIDQLLHDPRRLSFAILESGAHVGNVGLKDYEAGRTDAECFIEIGEVWKRGRGVGQQAMALLLDHCFERLNLTVVRLGVFDFNESAIRLYQRLGFRRSGRYGWHWAAGRYHEVLGMFVDRDTWRMRRLRLP